VEDIPMQSHVRLGVFFFKNPQKQPDAKALTRLTINAASMTNSPYIWTKGDTV